MFVTNENPIFINIANSIIQIKITGNDIDFKTNIMIMNMIAIDTVFTLLKSWSLISTKSFINGPSPTNIPFSSYYFIILLISFI